MSTKNIIKESLKKLVERRLDFTDYQQEDAKSDAEWLIRNINTLNENKQNLITQLESLTSEVKFIDNKLTGYEEDLNTLINKYNVGI